MERAKVEYVNSSDIRETIRVAFSRLSFAKRELLKTDEMQSWMEKNLFQPSVEKIRDTGDDSQIKFNDFLEKELKNKLETEIMTKAHGGDIAEAVLELANAIGKSIFKKTEAGTATESGNEPWVSPELRATENVFRNIWRMLRRALRKLLGGGIIPMENTYGEVQEKKPAPSAEPEQHKSDKQSAESEQPALAESELPTTPVQLPPVLAEQPALTEPEPSAPPKASNVVAFPVKKDDKVHSNPGGATTDEARHLKAA